MWKGLALALSLMIMLSLGYRFLFAEQSIFTWNTLKEENARLTNELIIAEQAKTDLSDKIRLLQTDSAYLEKMIRERLNYVKEDEILYIFDLKEESSPWTGSTAQ